VRTDVQGVEIEFAVSNSLGTNLLTKRQEH